MPTAPFRIPDSIRGERARRAQVILARDGLYFDAPRKIDGPCVGCAPRDPTRWHPSAPQSCAAS
jgi:hypothetical protein